MLPSSLRRTTAIIALIALAGISLVVGTRALAAWRLDLRTAVTAAAMVGTLAKGRSVEPLSLEVAVAATAFVVVPGYRVSPPSNQTSARARFPSGCGVRAARTPRERHLVDS